MPNWPGMPAAPQQSVLARPVGGALERLLEAQGLLDVQPRRALAGEMGITMKALCIRACRIRDKLEACVKDCMDRQ